MCGFFGLVAAHPVAAEVHMALQALQHRGQDSAGIATMARDGSRFFMRRGLGAAVNAIQPEELDALEGPIGIGHVRYPTIGAGTLEDTQPFFYRQPGILMAHNGNLTNYAELSEGLRGRSIHLLSHCDVEPALCELAHALVQRRGANHETPDLLHALQEMRARVRGAYSIAAALMLDSVPTLVVLRDPHGIRPAVVGRRDDGSWAAASETVALDVLGFTQAFEPLPGEAVLLRAGQEPERHPLGDAGKAACVFEQIYFARPDSRMDGKSVYQSRFELGTRLAERVENKELALDIVVPVPDTARPAATAIAEQLKLPLREGFIKNRYSGRTFIMPDAQTRNMALRLKLNPLPGELGGRRILLVDDSIVRGTTLRRVIRMARGAGATQVHLAIHAPPVRHPCFYGIDMSTAEELFASKFTGELADVETAGATELGADSLTYLPTFALDEVFGKQRCAACFDGCYPLEVSEPERQTIAQDRNSPPRPHSGKVSVR